ncbi:C45 family autoproteolytic acyltransferase/hydolase [Micromonospora sp. LOL_024]|uniref:C45 family autoproteolytic acyltransferase/hydolase n=1 Tax=Micromonospora sp. LOL_024 TaxID=3345412 RepID=UPI003A8BE9F4
MTVPYVPVGGGPYERGLRHGWARREALRAFLADGLCRLDRILPAPVDRDGLPELLAGYESAIRAATPDLAEEIRGLAAGAGLTLDEAVLLQVRREILGYQRVPTMGDCTTYACPGPDPLLAQTVDLNGDLDDQIAVLDTGSALVLSFGGTLGYLGVNRAGLAVGLNLVLGGQWRPGLPPYLAIRHLLDRAGSVTEAVGLLRDTPLASSRSIMLCDRDQAGYAEVLGDEVRFQPAAEPVHTNHFLDPEFAEHDEVNVFARNSSQRRLDACRTRLAALPAGAGAEEHFALLAEPPITVPDSGDVRRERTVAAVVAYGGRGELHVRPGDPSRSVTDTFTLR